MTDNVTFERNAKSTPKNGTVVATDDVSGVHYQVLKLDVGVDGTSVPVSNTGGYIPAQLHGISDVTNAAEDIISYRGALQTARAWPYRTGRHEHAKRNLDGSTTLDAAASVGDTLINVASTTNFSTGSKLTILGETSHFHVTALSTGVSLTLNRALDFAHNTGVAVQEVSINMNANGSLASPISYKVQPPAGEVWDITRMMFSMLDQTAMDDSLFGGLGELTNGVVVRTYRAGVYHTLTHWHSNADFFEDMYDVTYSAKAPSGFYGLSGRWSFYKNEYVIDLDGDAGDYIEILIQDNLTGLDAFQAKFHGRLLGS